MKNIFFVINYMFFTLNHIEIFNNYVNFNTKLIFVEESENQANIRNEERINNDPSAVLVSIHY